MVEQDRFDDGGADIGKLSSKVEKPQKPEKFNGLEEPSFLTSDTRLDFIKKESSRTKLMIENYCPLLKP